MRKNFLFLMVLAGSLMAFTGCAGAALSSLLLDGGSSLVISLIGSLITSALTPAATTT